MLPVTEMKQKIELPTLPKKDIAPNALHHGTGGGHKKMGLFALAVAAMGVVYGDIGTSPLYTYNETFFSHHGIATSVLNVLGITSLIFWTLLLVISGKYIIFVLRADYKGEGGTFAFLAHIRGLMGQKKNLYFLSLLLVFAGALLYGEGLITPAISILSAVEGLKVISPLFDTSVIPITLTVMGLLFYFQHKGTQKVGMLFGYVMIVWFSVIALIGLSHIISTPKILSALNPYYAVSFFLAHGFKGSIYVLGSVVLAMTGGEALWADLGHFGLKAIRVSWIYYVFPAILLCYFGQGAYLLSGAPIVNGNIFYSAVPEMLRVWMIPLATMATVIASQALISGAFSLTQQAINQGLFPRLKILHTSHTMEGQIYIPMINAALWIGCSLLVIVFKSSSNLAAAYGLAVTGVMTTTTITLFVIARRMWHWSALKTYAVFGVFLLIDLGYLGANLIKFVSGGYVPFTIGCIMFFIMLTWQWGRRIQVKAVESMQRMSIGKLVYAKTEGSVEVRRAMIFLSNVPIVSMDDVIPPSLKIFMDRVGALPKYLILFTVQYTKDPYLLDHERFELRYFTHNGVAREKGIDDNGIVSVVMNAGYMEQPDVREALHVLRDQGKIRIHEHNWTIYASKEKLYTVGGFWFSLRGRFFTFMQHLATPAHEYYGLDDDAGVDEEDISVIFSKEPKVLPVLKHTHWNPVIGSLEIEEKVS